ncbi:hypothetical protein [Streptomyces sp. GC420]|uniref:hypothetical protein n=1 Tax=Streptomyces sp. GC420 TaxID=2697568 RepID=UPI001AA16157|nr:hypothetical protein [Streptomyces sp. GC420]
MSGEMHNVACGAPVSSLPPHATAQWNAECRPLGKRQENLLAGVLRGVPLLGADGGAIPFREPDVRRFLRDFRSDCGRCDEERGLVNRLRPRVLDALVGAEARGRRGYVHGLPSGGIEALLRAAGRAALAPVVLRVVFGASTCVPLRALDYVLPAVGMAARLRAAPCPAPHLQVVLTSALGRHINELPADVVAREAELLVAGLDALLGHLAPVGSFGVYRDRPDAGTAERLARLAAGLTPAQRGRILDRLRGKGGAGGCEERTLRYAAAHALLHDHDGVPMALERGAPAPRDAVVIDVGGLQERHFHGVRAFFPPPPGTPGPGALVLSRHSVPPYTMARGGDIGLREFLDGADVSGSCLPGAVRHDLRHLWAHLGPDRLRALLADRGYATRPEHGVPTVTDGVRAGGNGVPAGAAG